MYIVEPQRGENILQSLNTFVSGSVPLFKFTSFLADFFVFLFPVLLVVLYVIGIRKKSRPLKIYAMFVFASAAVAALINIVIQQFVTKDRPETVLTGTQHLLLEHLPTNSFPSDHAAVSMAFAIALVCGVIYVIVRYSKKNDTSHTHFMENRKKFIWLGVFFLAASLIMSVARVAVGVHRPTDILVGWLIGWFVPYFLMIMPEGFFMWIVKIEEWIVKKLGIMQHDKK